MFIDRIWPKTSQMMRHYLEQTGLFEVEIVRTAPEGTDPDFRPDFSRYDVVVSNYNGARWPRETELRWGMRTIRWNAWASSFRCNGAPNGRLPAQVTQSIPDDFPGRDSISRRPTAVTP